MVSVTARVVIRMLDIARHPSTTPPPYPSVFRAVAVHGLATAQEIPTSPEYPDSPFNSQYRHQVRAAGLGGPANSRLEWDLQNIVDLCFIFLTRYGRIWPLSSESKNGDAYFINTGLLMFYFILSPLFPVHIAKAVAERFGIKVTNPELLRFGLFIDRNRGNFNF